MNVPVVSHEPGRQYHYARPVLVAEQRAIGFDILTGVFAVAVPPNELADVAEPVAEIPIQIDEGNTRALCEKRPVVLWPAPPGPTSRTVAHYSSESPQNRRILFPCREGNRRLEPQWLKYWPPHPQRRWLVRSRQRPLSPLRYPVLASITKRAKI
jgi:hypothetical protein